MNRSRSIRFSPWPLVLPLAAIAMAVAVFSVTQSVQRREARVTELNRQLLNEQQTLRVLDAEWAYLTRPQRLEELMAMKQDIVMPPAPAPVANIVQEDTAPQDVAAPVEVASAEVSAEPSAGETVAKPVIIQDTPLTKEVAHPSEKASQAKANAKPVAAKVAAPVKKTNVKTVSATTIRKKQPVPTKSMDGAWPIASARKGVTPQKQNIASVMPVRAVGARAGVARPIVE